jgi:hypothetical protein
MKFRVPWNWKSNLSVKTLHHWLCLLRKIRGKMAVSGTRGKTAQPVMINYTEGRTAVSTEFSILHTHTHIYISSDSFNSIFKATPSVTGASTKQMGCQCQLFLAAVIHNGRLNKVCFMDTDRQTANAHSYMFSGKNEPTVLDLTTCSHHLQSTYFYRKVSVKSVN